MKLTRTMLDRTMLALVCAAGVSGTAFAEMTKMVGGAPMLPSRNIIQNAVDSKDNTTLVAAVKVAGLVDTLQGSGPFTVFAPTNAAFDRLPAGIVESLMKPEKKNELTNVLTYHVLPGRLTTREFSRAVEAGKGKLSLKTVQGEAVTIARKGGSFTITDSKGRTAHITIADVSQSNGVIHVIDKVLLP
jgi:uncharacterized surface protein with fasciclin (FAS1) repeats